MALAFPKNSITKIVMAYTFWWMLWAVLGAYALTSTVELSWKMALADSVNACMIMGTAGYIMSNILRYYRPSSKNILILFIESIGLAVLCVVLQRYLNLYKDDATYLAFFSQSIPFRFLFAWLMITLIGILSWIWFYIQDQQYNEKIESDAAKLAKEAELSSLRQQLQPHFLFNSLNSISALAGSKPEEARKMIQQLSDFLRGTIKRDNQQMVSLQEELHHLNLYLEIEKVRFGHRLNTVIEQEAASLNLSLPSLLLQPLVENSIKFGLYDTIGEITIKLEAKAEDNHLLIKVENPFDPQTTQPKGTGFGLNSVQRRLYLLYARNDLLSTEMNENIFTTTIKIPQNV
jgi:two-component system, LytTR family, sensor kinase